MQRDMMIAPLDDEEVQKDKGFIRKDDAVKLIIHLVYIARSK